MLTSLELFQSGITIPFHRESATAAFTPQSLELLDTKVPEKFIEYRRILLAERLKILSLTLPETLIQGYTAMRPALSLERKNRIQEQDMITHADLCFITERVDINTKLVKDVEDLIKKGLFRDNPRLGLDSVRFLINSNLISNMLQVEEYLEEKFPLPARDDERSIRRIGMLENLKGSVEENLQQLYRLEAILRTPAREPIPVYVGYSKEDNDHPIFMIADKHTPRSMRQAA